MGNTDSNQKYEKLDFLPQQQQPRQQQARTLDETVHQRPPAPQQRTLSPKPQRLQSQQVLQHQPAYQQQQQVPQIVQQIPMTQHHPLMQPMQATQPLQAMQPLQATQPLSMAPLQQAPQIAQMQDWRLNMQHPHILKTLGGQPEGDQMRYYFEFCPINLQGLLSDRVGTKKHFPEDDLQAMLLGVSSAISFLQEQGLSHGDLNDAEIFFDQASSSFKVLDSSLINGRAAGVVAALQGRPGQHISPELYQALSQHPPQTLFHQLQQLPEELLCKNDVWCLGMVMLQACLLLQNLDELYQNGLFKIDLLQYRLAEVSQIYSPELTYALQIMLQPKYELRQDAVTLFAHFAQLFQQANQQQQLQQPQYLPPQQQYAPYDYYQQPIQAQPQPQQQLTQQSMYQMQTPIQQHPSQTPNMVQQPQPQQMPSMQERYKQPSPIRVAPQQTANVPVKQVIKQIVYPDGRVEYQVQQPTEDLTAPRPQVKPATSPSRYKQQINYGQTMPVPMHQIGLQDAPVYQQPQPRQRPSEQTLYLPDNQHQNILGNIENRQYIESVKPNDPYEKNNIHRLKQEIEQSKLLIQQYQQKSENTIQKRKENDKTESIEDRIRKVIAQSQALRENFA